MYNVHVVQYACTFYSVPSAVVLAVKLGALPT